MPTAASWTEVRRAVTDVALPHRLPHHDRPAAARVRLGVAVFVGLTVAAATLPAMAEGAGTSKGYSLDAVLLIPTAMAGFCSWRSPRRSPRAVAASCSTASTP